MPGPTTDVAQLIGIEADVERRRRQEEDARAHARANGLDEDKTVQFAQYYGRLPLTPNEKANLTPVPRAPVFRSPDTSAYPPPVSLNPALEEAAPRERRSRERAAAEEERVAGEAYSRGREADVQRFKNELPIPTPMTPFEAANRGASSEELAAAVRPPPPFTGAGAKAIGSALRGVFPAPIGPGVTSEELAAQLSGEEGRFAQALATLGGLPAVGPEFEALSRSAGPAARMALKGTGAVARSAAGAAFEGVDVATQTAFEVAGAPLRAALGNPSVQVGLHDVGTLARGLAESEAGGTRAELVAAYKQLRAAASGVGIYSPTLPTKAEAYARLQAQVLADFADIKKSLGEPVFKGQAVERGVGVTNRKVSPATGEQADALGKLYVFLKENAPKAEAAGLKQVRAPAPQAYEMTKEQYAAAAKAVTPEEKQLAALAHESHINDALNEGKTVPWEVLNQYPQQRALPREDPAQTTGLHENAQIRPISPADVAAYKESLGPSAGGAGQPPIVSENMGGGGGSAGGPPPPGGQLEPIDLNPSFGRIHPKTQQLLDVVTPLGLPRQQVERALGLQSITTPTANAIMNTFNGIRGLADDVRQLHAPVRQHFMYSQQYEMGQNMYVATRLVGLDRLATDTFTSSVLKDFSSSAPMISLRAAYKGEVTRASDKFVGLLVDAYENPKTYSLTSEQSKAVAQADTLLRRDLEFTRETTGMDIGTIKQNYIPHMVRSETGHVDHTAISALLGQIERGRPGFTQERTAPTIRDLFAVVDSLNAANPALKLYVVTDYRELMAQRLAASASMRADALFLRGLTHETGGGLMKPGASVPLGFSVFQHKGQDWAVRTEFMEDLTDRIFAKRYSHDVDRFASSAITSLRDILLNLDLSPSVGIQGLISLRRNSAGAFSAWKQAFQMRMTDHGNAMWLAMNVEGLMDASLHGLQLRYIPTDTDSLLFTNLGKGPMERLPGIKQINEFQLNTLSLIYKYEMYKRNVRLLQLSHDLPVLGRMLTIAPVIGDAVAEVTKLGLNVTDANFKRMAADATNNWLGGLNMAKIHIHPGSSNLHKLVLLTEGWTRALIGTHITALKPGLEGDLARGLLLQDYLITAGVLTGLGYILHQEVDIDPRSQNYGKLRVGGVTVNIDPRAATTRMVAQLIGGRLEDENIAGDSAALQRLKALQWWATSRASQPLSMTTNVVQGTDYMGRRISNPAIYVLSNIMPVMLQNIAQTAQMDMSGGDIATTAAFSGAGMNVNPLSRTRQLADLATGKYASEIAQQRAAEQNPTEFTGKYSELSPKSRGFLNLTPEGRKINESFGDTEAQRARMEVRDFHDVQLMHDQALKNGTLNDRPYHEVRWRHDHTTLEAQRVGSSLFKDAIKRAKPSTPEGKALEDYYNFVKSFGVLLHPGDNVPEVDYDAIGFTDARESHLDGYGPKLRAYVEANLHPSATSKEEEFFADMKTLRPYFDVLKDTLAKAGDTKMWEDFRQSGLPEQYAIRHGANAGKIRLYEAREKRLKEAMRIEHADIATAAYKWGFTSTERPQGTAPGQAPSRSGLKQPTMKPGGGSSKQPSERKGSR